MAAISEQRLFDALATLTRAFAEEGLPAMPGADAAPEAPPDAGPDAAPGDPPRPGADPAIAKLDEPMREVLGEAALAVAFGAFASRGGDGGPIQTLIASLGLMAILAGEEPDPPAEILGIAAEDSRVDAEVERAGEALDREFGREADAATATSALEARILGTAITLAGCTLPEDVDGPVAVRLRAARVLVRLAAGLMAMNAAGAGLPAPAAAAPEPGPA